MLLVRYLILLTLFVLNQAFSSEPAASTAADTAGSPETDIGCGIDPNGCSRTDGGGAMEPNG
ncbi:MAG TPA: hypothetical protein VE974_15455 [Thermoanaerobaculia bacterium]|nr:hypothetical protein [Thermoanaerobaculia bacterium]